VNIFKPFRKFVLLFIFLYIIAAPALAADHFSLVVFGDPQGQYDVFQDLIQKVNAENDISFAVSCGDLVSEGNYQDYLRYNELTKELKVKLYNVMGNHDAVRGSWKHFNKFFGEAFYSFDYKNSHFIVIDNSFDQRLTQYQMGWLRSDLAKNDKENIFVFMHRPLFDVTGFFGSYAMESEEKSQILQQLFEKHKVNVVFAGHIHGFSKGLHNGVFYIITAGAGATIYMPEFMGGYFHYVKVNVDGEDVTYTVVPVYD